MNSRSFQEMISDDEPSAFSCSTAPSVKPASSDPDAAHDERAANGQPAGKWRVAPSSITADQASSAESADAPSRQGCADLANVAGETRRPMTRSPASVCSR